MMKGHKMEWVVIGVVWLVVVAFTFGILVDGKRRREAQEGDDDK